MKLKKYDHNKIEKFWQKKWAGAKLFKTKTDSKKKKCYVLDMFPFPSGDGLHVGHPKGYIATDVYSRFKKMNGFEILHPMGWDAFGLPAENYAIKNKIHPEVAVKKNIKRFKDQLQKIGFNYDWSREINTSNPEYYKWTQWMFLQMFKKGIAYESYEPINWCPSCQTGLANEDLDGDNCERCGTLVEKKPMRQWVLKITEYAERMLKDLDTLPWPSHIKELQKNWIGKSEGIEIDFRIKNSSDSIKVFTTRADTVFGATYVVLSPEHPLLKSNKLDLKNAPGINKYITDAGKISEIERVAEKREKTGVKLEGIVAINPFNNKEINVWVADYVLANYGTGAVMAVPAHDERDFEFAKKHNIKIDQVIAPKMIDKSNPPRPGKKNITRKTIHALVKRSDGKFLCLKWRKFPWTTFIVGGVDDNESLIDAAKREVREETGYKNLKFIKTIDQTVCAEYFAAHKDENRIAYANAVIFDLVNEEKDTVSKEEDDKHEIIWKEIRDINSSNFTCAELDFWMNGINEKEKAYTNDGVLFNSGEYSGLSSEDARNKMAVWLEKNKFGKKTIKYKLKDWVFSRQRYWGEPIPIVHCETCGIVPVDEKDLPVKLPKVKSYAPTGTGESPLADISKWVNTKCPTCKGPAKRETNTMPNWAGSSWYYLRYIDPKNKKVLADKKEEAYWSPVDMYVGGAEHATRHLIYARFWHKFLYDIGAVSNTEPFKQLHSVGLILAEDGKKMSKRWGNVINPDDMVKTFGADSLRVYEMFMGPFSQPIAWNTNNMVGGRRFLEKIWRLQFKVDKKTVADEKVETLLHETIKKVSDDIENFSFNTAISQMMIFTNELDSQEKISRDVYKNLLVLLSPFAPHITDEIWHNLDGKKFIYLEKWPTFDPSKIQKKTFNLVLSINGKMRDTIEVEMGIEEAKAKELALANENIKKHLEGKEVKKVIYVKDRLINIVV